MNRIGYLLIAGTIVAAAAAAISFGRARASHHTSEFIQISVLADTHANYEVDGDLYNVMAPISMKIIGSKINDDADVQVSTTIITSPPSSTENAPVSGDQTGSTGGDEDGEGNKHGHDEDGEDKDRDKDK